MSSLEEKYIDLLLKKCTDLEKSNLLFISYHKEIKDFIDHLVEKAKEYGFEEFYLDEEDPFKTHEILKNSTIEEIEKSSYFDESIWDTYAGKGASFLIFDTEYPHLMDDIDSKKIALSSKRRRESRPLYRKLVENCQLSWCIAAYPGESWANDIFHGEMSAYQKLEQFIYQICMIHEENPILCWEELLNKNSQVIKVLNALHFEKLHYINQLGTDLEIYLPEEYCFSSAQDDRVIVNMPSYEVFASPIYNKTKGIVYNSIPLIYNGVVIDQFWLKFEEGKVVDFDAKVGKDTLEKILNSDANSGYLGECALVEYNSPISNLNCVFKTTLIDENASCHLALGAGFPECIKNGFDLTDEELLSRGINVSKNHVDFMIGTSDLRIIGTTREGDEISIFSDGNFDSKLLQLMEKKLL